MRVPASLPAWAKLALLLLYVALTNPSVPARLRELAGREEYPALVVFLAIWAVSLACLVAACFLPRLGWRLLWAVPIALSVFAGEAFSHIARSRLTLDDALILWVERARWGDAVVAYGGWLARAGFAAVTEVITAQVPQVIGWVILVERNHRLDAFRRGGESVRRVVHEVRTGVE